MVEVEGRDVLDARMEIVDRRRRPLAQPQLEEVCIAISAARANTEAKPSSCVSARKAFEADTSTAMIRSAPRMRAVPTGRLSTVAPSM